MKGHIDFTLIDELVGWHIISSIFSYQNQMDKFAVTEKAERSNTFHLMVSRAYPNAKTLNQKFNEGLQAIKKNGTYHKILRRYSMSLDYGVPD